MSRLGVNGKRFAFYQETDSLKKSKSDEAAKGNK